MNNNLLRKKNNIKMSKSNRSDCSLSCSSIDELCDKKENNMYEYKVCYPNEQCPAKRYDPGVSYFTSIITPVTNLTPQYSNTPGCVEFRMRRKNKTVILQWEPFSGTMASNGIAFLTVTQSICNTPPYQISNVITIQYKGSDRMVKINVDPYTKNGNVFFYLNADGSSNNINIGDAFYVYGGAISWIVD